MEIELGMQPNCSETVYRFSDQYKKWVEDTIKYLKPHHLEPTLGYSQMRPGQDEVCYYFYQTGGEELRKLLEKNKIIYDSQCPFGDAFEEWEEIEPNKLEKEELSSGGSGQFYRRKPYGN